jgi:hypothetical protein
MLRIVAERIAQHTMLWLGSAWERVLEPQGSPYAARSLPGALMCAVYLAESADMKEPLRRCAVAPK